MEAIILTKEQYSSILEILNEIKSKLASNAFPMDEEFVDNEIFMKKMGVSKRTAQKWRDEGAIAYSQIGKKIYYKVTDVEELLQQYHRNPFRKPFRKR